MAVKIKDLEQQKIRKKIQVQLENGEVDTITVYNAVGVKREQLINLIKRSGKIVDNVENDVESDMLKEMVTILTDLKIHARNNFQEIIENPSVELSMVLREINEVYFQLQYEFLAIEIMKMNQGINIMMGGILAEKSRIFADLSQETESGNTNIEDLADELEKELEYLNDQEEEVDDGESM